MVYTFSKDDKINQYLLYGYPFNFTARIKKRGKNYKNNPAAA
jgi:hypothetical protein